MPTRRGRSGVEKGRDACIAPVAAHPRPLISGGIQIRIVLDHKMTRALHSALVMLFVNEDLLGFAAEQVLPSSHSTTHHQRTCTYNS